MNWWTQPELLDRLAGAYALGTLHGGARRRFEAVMAAHPAVALAAARWAQRLQPLGDSLPPLPLPADDALWQRIEGRLFGAARQVGQTAANPTTAATAAPTPWWRRWLGPHPAGALAFGLVAGLALPLLAPLLNRDGVDPTQLPESYVGVLATASGQPGLIISSLRRGRTLDLKLLQAVPLPPGKQWVLWTLDAKGQPQPAAALPELRGRFVSLPLPQDAEALFFRAVELAISAEPLGPLPASGAQPSQPYAWRGLCGKLWRVVPTAASTTPPATTPPAPAPAAASAAR